MVTKLVNTSLRRIKCFIDSKYISQDNVLITHGKHHKHMVQKSSRPCLKKQSDTSEVIRCINNINPMTQPEQPYFLGIWPKIHNLNLIMREHLTNIT